jgi:hypothetical protein
MDETYRRYLAELDDVLLNGSPKTLGKFMKCHGMKLPSSDEVLRVTFHKAITSAKTLPLQYRRQSKQWLEAHHYHSLDDGDSEPFRGSRSARSPCFACRPKAHRPHGAW